MVAFTLGVTGCGRTGLEPTDPPGDAGVDRPPDLPADRMDAPPDLAPDLPVEHPPDLAPDREMHPDVPTCVPTAETCNGIDDDCNGLIDDGLPPIPCPNGNGYRQCVGGAYSDCPRRCQVCVPGSKRTCITSFCTFWGNQECAADGMSFGPCKEAQPPAACADVANRMQRSADLEQCCIDNGYCCVDEFDLNHNNDRTEMLGRCDAIVCQ
ncbi:MAG TPA: hypothetical protein VKQ32_18010 [Polyangia bacterium]|nr:hypothetical protein [Polyangia bacterium]